MDPLSPICARTGRLAVSVAPGHPNVEHGPADVALAERRLEVQLASVEGERRAAVEERCVDHWSEAGRLRPLVTTSGPRRSPEIDVADRSRSIGTEEDLPPVTAQRRIDVLEWRAEALDDDRLTEPVAGVSAGHVDVHSPEPAGAE